jgi:phosphatidylinositol alpha 1,6-mannosyltransferase
VQEAHASGLPVIAPRAGGPIDLVEHGVDGCLFAPEDDASLRLAVELVLADPMRRPRMGEAGRRKVLRRSWSAVGDDLIGHYEHVIAARAIDSVLLRREFVDRVPRFD